MPELMWTDRGCNGAKVFPESESQHRSGAQQQGPAQKFRSCSQPRFSIAFSFESLSLILSLSLIFHAALAHVHLSYTGKIVYLLVSLKPLGLLGLG